MNILIVLQGHSGAGKSTLARNHLAPLLTALGHDVIICSTDDYHVDEDGVYRFKPDKLGVFHKLNADKAIAALKAGKTVIVDNTNLKNFEAKPYVKTAVELGVPISFHSVYGDFKNEHGVPEHKVEAMKFSREPLSVQACLASKAPWE